MVTDKGACPSCRRKSSKSYRPLGRLAHGNRPAIDKTYWRHQEVPIAEEDSIFAPRFCPDCREFIINDEHGNPHCPSCGLLFPDPNSKPIQRPQRVSSTMKFHREAANVPPMDRGIRPTTREYKVTSREQSPTESAIGPLRISRSTTRF